MRLFHTFIGFLLLASCCSVGVAQQDAEIRELIEQLVFDHPRAAETPLLSPRMGSDDDPEYVKQFEKCHQAFGKLRSLGEKAFPMLVAHRDDKRASIHFRNHYLDHSVGAACYWNLYGQLTDLPQDYSSYGLVRKGRDGQNHTKPYWAGTPFGQAGGLKPWLEQNSGLSYHAKQIKCLTWLLEREKAIGASDPESYFENILPLEIRILERRLDLKEDVKKELAHLREVMSGKLAKEIPPELLPDEPGKKD